MRGGLKPFSPGVNWRDHPLRRQQRGPSRGIIPYMSIHVVESGPQVTTHAPEIRVPPEQNYLDKARGNVEEELATQITFGSDKFTNKLIQNFHLIQIHKCGFKPTNPSTMLTCFNIYFENKLKEEYGSRLQSQPNHS